MEKKERKEGKTREREKLKKTKEIEKRLVHRHGETSWTPRSETVSTPAMTDPFFLLSSFFVLGRAHRVKFFFFAPCCSVACEMRATTAASKWRAFCRFIILLTLAHSRSFFPHPLPLLPPLPPLHSPTLPFRSPFIPCHFLSFSLSHPHPRPSPNNE